MSSGPTHIHVVPIPNAMADKTGAIQCVLFADHANQKSEMGKQNAAAMDIGSRSSGAILWFCFWYFFSKYSLASGRAATVIWAVLTGSRARSRNS